MTPNAFRESLHNTFTAAMADEASPLNGAVALLAALEYLQDSIIADAAANAANPPVFFELSLVATHLNKAHGTLERLLPEPVRAAAIASNNAAAEAPSGGKPSLQLLEKPELANEEIGEEGTGISTITGEPIQEGTNAQCPPPSN